MISLQLLIGVICLGVFIGYSSAIDVLKINKISLISNIAIDIEDTTGVGKIDTKFTLIVAEAAGDDSNQKFYPTTTEFIPGTDKQTLVFNFKGDEEFSKKYNLFILIGEQDRITVLEASLLIYLNEIPKNEIKSKIVGEKSLRIKENLVGWEICNDLNTDTVPLKCMGDTSAPCYALDMEASTTGTYTVCNSTITVPPVPVLVQSITVANDATDNPSPLNITLEYSTSPSSTKLYIDSDITSLSKGETVFYKIDKSLVTICNSGTECVIDTFTGPSESSYSVILVKKGATGNQATGSVEKPFYDPYLEVFALETTILETRWVWQKDAYTATLTTVTGEDSGIPFHTVNADCASHGSGFCYAYYVAVVPGDTYTVAVKADINPLTDQLNQITSAPFIMATLSSSKVADNLLKNITIDKRYKKDSGDFELNICYSHDSKYAMINTQLEVILISPSRQWRRIIEKDLQKAEQRPCYSNTFALDSENYSDSLLTALLIQRNVTSHDVLSYQRMDLNHPAIRAIEPEVDYGKNGSTSTLAIVGAAIGGIACLMALVAAAVMFVMKIKKDNDGVQYPLHRTNIEQDSDYIHGLDNPIPTM